MQRYSKESVVGIFVLIGLACIGYMTVKLGDIGLFEDDTYTLMARFSKVTITGAQLTHRWVAATTLGASQ